MANTAFLVITLTIVFNAIFHLINIDGRPIIVNREIKWRTSVFHIIMFMLSFAAFLLYGLQCANCHCIFKF